MLEKLFKIFCAVLFVVFITSMGGVLIWGVFRYPEAILIPVLGLLGIAFCMSFPAMMVTGYDEVMSWFESNKS